MILSNSFVAGPSSGQWHKKIQAKPALTDCERRVVHWLTLLADRISEHDIDVAESD